MVTTMDSLLFSLKKGPATIAECIQCTFSCLHRFTNIYEGFTTRICREHPIKRHISTASGHYTSVNVIGVKYFREKFHRRLIS